jgi:hypothetical protein
LQVVRWISPTGKRRSLMTLGAADTAAFRRATALALPRPPASPRSFGRERPPGRPLHTEREAWRAALRAAMLGSEGAVVSDVAACYPSIGVRAIRMASAAAGGNPDELLAFLRRTSDAGAPGLPIGPASSAVIADAVLAIADREAAAAGLPPIRWVDDVVFAGARVDVARAERAWRGALRDLGLRDHEGKRHSVRALGDLSVPSLAARPDRVIMRSS